MDESEAIAAAQKLAEMFGGTVVMDFDDSNFDRNTVDRNDRMIVEASNQVENFPKVSEEPIEQPAIEQPAIAPQAVSWPENGQSPEHPISMSEEKLILESLKGEEYGDCEF